MRKFGYFVLFFFFSGTVLYSSSEGFIPHFVNYYEWMLYTLGGSRDYIPFVSSLVVTAVLFLIGKKYKKQIEKQQNIPEILENKFSMKIMIDWILDLVHGIAFDNCGNFFRLYFPFLGAVFVFVLFNSLVGLVPGVSPATGDISNNLAVGLIAFFVYNAAGFKVHGFRYLKQFLGPMLILAPVFVVLEVISHSTRPFSLALRLLGNIYGDHLLLGVFTGLTKVVVPSILMFFGFLVAGMQSFVFTLLTSLYISMAVSDDH